MTKQVVGRQRELELVRAALASGAHILLEGPPGTGKSTLLRQVAQARHAEFVLVEGSAELTPARLIGSFDPALFIICIVLAKIVSLMRFPYRRDPIFAPDPSRISTSTALLSVLWTQCSLQV